MSNQVSIGQSKIHLLDVGAKEYGDAVLCRFEERRVLIDGAHPGDQNGSPGHNSIPAQLAALLGETKPFSIDLLIVTHAHQDHIGCLPQLITDQELNVKWALLIDPGLGWGRADGEDRDADFTDERTTRLAAALREEVYSGSETDNSSFQDFLSDAATLESRYNQMLEDLKQQGTKIVRFGRDTQAQQLLLAEFADINLKILGPGVDHLLACAELINIKTKDSLKSASDFFRLDAAADELAVYKQLISAKSGNPQSLTDALDAEARPGPAINLQSIITQCEYGGHKFLFAGDFQFARPEVTSKEIIISVERLRKAIRHEAPYSFYKLSHHGSDNGFSDEIYDDLVGTNRFGMCAGEQSTHHPNRKVLALLDKHKEDIEWARTDHNGLVTLTFNEGQVDPILELSKGNINDPQANDADITKSSQSSTPIKGSQTISLPLTQQPSLSTSQKLEELKTEKLSGSSVSIPAPEQKPVFIELTAKIPHTKTKICFTGDFSIEVDPIPLTAVPKSEFNEDIAKPELLIGGGRKILKDLLFVTSRDALALNIGRAEAAEVIASITTQNIPLFADLPPGLSNSGQSAEIVRGELRQHPNIKGVVILGGYDVVPAQILDCLPSSLRNSMPSNDDPDNFVVWSDEVYGDLDGDGLPEIPVSRIPDGKSAALVFKALQANHSQVNNERFGIRNIARPFAKSIFENIPGTGSMLSSKQTIFEQLTNFSADQVYFMLHGDYIDSSRFWGEGTERNREAINVGNLPEEFTGVVFTGCCWGALTVNTPAGLTVPNRPFGQKTIESSIALSFLAKGANSFIGCTGAHYSPTDPPYDYFGGPMHTAFWENYKNGLAPAEALFRAKIEYIRKMPHGRTGDVQMAIEYKILRQYTCLGLGW